jgi:hypothetical protein
MSKVTVDKRASRSPFYDEKDALAPDFPLRSSAKPFYL